MTIAFVYLLMGLMGRLSHVWAEDSIEFFDSAEGSNVQRIVVTKTVDRETSNQAFINNPNLLELMVNEKAKLSYAGMPACFEIMIDSINRIRDQRNIVKVSNKKHSMKTSIDIFTKTGLPHSNFYLTRQKGKLLFVDTIEKDKIQFIKKYPEEIKKITLKGVVTCEARLEMKPDVTYSKLEDLENVQRHGRAKSK